MKILMIEPGKKPEEVEIEGSLKSMQSLVGGMIQAVYPFPAPTALICNDEDKLLRLPSNRALRHPENHEVYDIICGTCFLCGAPPDSGQFTSLSPEQMGHYKTLFRYPEAFFKTDGGLVVLPIYEEE